MQASPFLKTPDSSAVQGGYVFKSAPCRMFRSFPDCIPRRRHIPRKRGAPLGRTAQAGEHDIEKRQAANLLEQRQPAIHWRCQGFGSQQRATDPVSRKDPCPVIFPCSIPPCEANPIVLQGTDSEGSNQGEGYIKRIQPPVPQKAGAPYANNLDNMQPKAQALRHFMAGPRARRASRPYPGLPAGMQPTRARRQNLRPRLATQQSSFLIAHGMVSIQRPDTTTRTTTRLRLHAGNAVCATKMADRIPRLSHRSNHSYFKAKSPRKTIYLCVYLFRVK